VSQPSLYLVFPFENAGASARMAWLGEGLEELTIQRLSGAGEQVYSHSGRIAELERSGLPDTAKLSRATMLRIAQDLDADYVVFGSFKSDGTTLTVESRTLKVNPTALLPAVRETGPLDALMELHAKLVWRMISANDRGYPLNLAEFSKSQPAIRLDAFEHYARGLLASEDEVRLRELREAARLEPEWAAPDFALGETYFLRKDCNSALPWYARVPKTHERSVEAIFATGVCRLILDQPEKAEEVFTGLQEGMRANLVAGADLPEILNNVALARARQGKTAEAQADLRRAVELDPDEDDYPFNLGLLAIRAKDFAGAASNFREAIEREPDNPEDRAFLIWSLEKSGKKEEAEQERVSAAESLGADSLPVVHVDAKGENLIRVERIQDRLDATTLALEIESGGAAGVTAADSAAASSAMTSAAHVRSGRQELSAGKVDLAESEFRAALVSDPGNAAAHRGLAEVERRRGHADEAIKELQASLQAQDSAVVRVTLARMYLEQKKIDLARAEVERALKLAPNYSEAKQLLERLQSSKPQGTNPKGGAQ
jgi:Tfp pilus assembly protein PilF/TolB-like protein